MENQAPHPLTVLLGMMLAILGTAIGLVMAIGRALVINPIRRLMAMIGLRTSAGDE